MFGFFFPNFGLLFGKKKPKFTFFDQNSAKVVQIPAIKYIYLTNQSFEFFKGNMGIYFVRISKLKKKFCKKTLVFFSQFCGFKLGKKKPDS